jgi:hypothetical protein
MKIHTNHSLRKKLKQRISVLLFFLFYSLYCYGQNPDNLKSVSSGKKFSVAAGVKIPVGQFALTHSIGFGAEFGRSPASQRIKAGKIDFTYNSGVSFFTGKNEMVSGYDYTYPSYLFFHAFGGLSCKLADNTELSLTAGPALGLYNKTANFNLGSSLRANYFFNTKFGAGAGLLLMKEKKADPLLSISIQGIMLL